MLRLSRISTAFMTLALAGPLAASAITQGTTAAVPPEQFQIMTPKEAAAHSNTIASLSGTAREEYRNTEYTKLKDRALAQGYMLPDTPPWGRTEVLPAGNHAIAGNLDERRAALKAAVEALRAQAQPSTPEPVTVAAASAPEPAAVKATNVPKPAKVAATSAPATPPAEPAAPAAVAEPTAPATVAAPVAPATGASEPSVAAISKVSGPAPATTAESTDAAKPIAIEVTTAAPQQLPAEAAVPVVTTMVEAQPEPAAVPDATGNPTVPATTTQDVAGNAYRESMRQRMEVYLSEREARNAELQKQRDEQAQAQAQALAAYQQYNEAMRQWSMYPYGYPPAVPTPPRRTYAPVPYWTIPR